MVLRHAVDRASLVVAVVPRRWVDARPVATGLVRETRTNSALSRQSDDRALGDKPPQSVSMNRIIAIDTHNKRAADPAERHPAKDDEACQARPCGLRWLTHTHKSDPRTPARHRSAPSRPLSRRTPPCILKRKFAPSLCPKGAQSSPRCDLPLCGCGGWWGGVGWGLGWGGWE